MDSLHAIGFYVSSGISVAGGLGVALLPRRDTRGASLLVVAIGLAGIYLALSAGFAAAVALICYAGAAVVLAGPRYRSVDVVVGPLWRQLGAVGAAALLVLVAYSAFRGAFAHITFHGGAFGTATIGRLLFEHDALAVEAIAALVLVALAGAAAAWRVRDRTR
jgi:NADH:ubiquinone oxidoreductase subunit 6 (subunit J)